MSLRLTFPGLIGAATLAATGCAGGAPDSVGSVRGTTLADGSTLNSCLDKAGYKGAAELADGVEAKKLGNGDAFHVVTVTSGDKQVQFTVVTERGFVYAYDDASVALLDKAGCSMDGGPLNETTT